ncbi:MULTISPECIES: GUN4 domain-containing protein [unclassified Leptolyngbya]|uniref:GUN4 domain-containing protein n=1 Tax=unclassified Leptolyngbya TaxID=2650499 RepID=UPI0016841D8E|nr:MULTISPECIES: GUN4 domain-containing protein [unclassified Leptolyngbya]MBD1910554.1 GUN4 domain-containing protein [Leptolyngbya sp. FACHB-8]MBD2153925.1 GUN4 domain-containing protein [Leptolyngbya sp. FACHB-16]
MDEDYAQLEKYLKSGLWRLADLETRKLFYTSCGLNPNDQQRLAVNQLPCDVLQNTDQLWLRYSRKRFGFSVQRQIWNACQEKYYDKTEAWNQFGSKVGWRVNHLLKQNYWKPHKELTFKSEAPVGHLPHMGEQFGIYTVQSLIQQLDYCASTPAAF